LATTLTQLADVLQTLFTSDAERCARDAGAVQRVRCFSGDSLLQTLVFACLEHPNVTLDDFVDTAADLGVHVGTSALDERLNHATAAALADLLSNALQYTIAAHPATPTLLRRFRGVYILDSTSISLPPSLAAFFPGCGGLTAHDGLAAVKLQIRIELTQGILDGLTGDTGRSSDGGSELAQEFLPPGSLRLTDLGYFDLEAMRAYEEQRVYYLSRLAPRTKLCSPGGDWQSVAAFLATATDTTVDQRVWVGLESRLPCRLIAVRVPPRVAARRLRRLQETARRKQRKVSVEQKALCDWTVLITNLGPEKLSVAEALALQRARWQIELFIKVWKSEGRIDESHGRSAPRVQCELLAKLVAMIVQHWVILVTGGPRLETSARRAARRVRAVAGQLLVALGGKGPAGLRRVLSRLRRRLGRLAGIRPRCRQPSTLQILEDPEREAWRGRQL
jgi:Transposase DDE domain